MVHREASVLCLPLTVHGAGGTWRPPTAHSDNWPLLLPSWVAFEGQPPSAPCAERDKPWEQAGRRRDVLAQGEEPSLGLGFPSGSLRRWVHLLNVGGQSEQVQGQEVGEQNALL